MPSTSTDPYLIDSHKMLYHSERVAQWKNASHIDDKLKIYPIYIEISPVGHCNHRCSFCAVDYIGYKARSLDTFMLSERLAEMGRLGVKSVMFAGEGEPLLHKEIEKLVTASYNAGIDCSFTTNGVLGEKLLSVVDKIKWIKVSMNGGEKSYEKVHKAKEGDYEKVWANLQALNKRRKEETAGCVIGIQCVVLPENTEDLLCIVKRAREVGLDYIVLKPYSQHKSSITTKYAMLQYDDKDIRELLWKCKDMEEEGFKVVVRENAMEDWDQGAHKYEKCYATPYFWAYVMATGDVYSCSAYLLNEKFKMGNIIHESFKDVWEGQRRRVHLKEMENLDISQCRLNCRMNQVNKYLDNVAHPNLHANFI